MPKSLEEIKDSITPCTTCDGSGRLPNFEVNLCPDCHGVGSKFIEPVHESILQRAAKEYVEEIGGDLESYMAGAQWVITAQQEINDEITDKLDDFWDKPLTKDQVNDLCMSIGCNLNHYNI
jgi:hypothetical protein